MKRWELALVAALLTAGGGQAEGGPGLVGVLFDDTAFQRPVRHGRQRRVDFALTGYHDCSRLWLGRLRFPPPTISARG